MEEELITFETAKLAKEKGFDITLYTSYINGVFHENEAEPNGYDGWDIPHKENWNKKGWIFTKEESSCFNCKLDNIKYFEACSAPTQSLLQKWLREKHKISVTIFSSSQESWSVKVNTPSLTGLHGNIEQFHYKGVDFYTYEEALEEGLYQALKLIN